MKPSPHEIYLVLKQFVDSNKCIDDKAARWIAQCLFGIEDDLAESATVYKINPICNSLYVWNKKIGVNRYVGIDEFYLYYVKFGYDPDSNIIVYSEKIVWKALEAE